MPEDRLTDYLADIDAAQGWFPEAAGWDGFPPSFDEWNAARLVTGLSAGDFDAYLADIDVPIAASLGGIADLEVPADWPSYPSEIDSLGV